MRFPQVSDRVKEAPAQALRGVFAGIGQLLLLTDKLRNKPPAQRRKPQISAPQRAARPAPPRPTTKPAAAVPDSTFAAGPAAAPEPSPAAPSPAAPSPDRPSLTDTAAAGLPLPNYDQLSVASLRARLRNLDVAQLRQLTRYERAHAARPEVIAMYERRVTKLEDERASAAGAAAAEAEVAARTEVADQVRAELEAEGDA